MNIISDDIINKDLYDVARLFDWRLDIKADCEISGNNLLTGIQTNGKLYSFKDKISANEELLFKRLEKRYAKKHLYDVLKQITGKYLPWGSITGIRPVKLYGQIEEETGDADNYFLDFFDVKEEKLQLVKQIYDVQKKYLIPANEAAKYADIYVGIPFCKGRCSYCSFFSADCDKNKDLIDCYIDNLVKEIKCVIGIIDKKGYIINSIYVGGGTPTSLAPGKLEKALALLKTVTAKEFTVEAGRPDSISAQMLDMLAKNNVSRISINPQTVNEGTLKLIGRAHSIQDFYNAFDIAKKYSFIINADIIAGLPQENLNDFINTVKSVISLNPHNITVHTLALKHGADLNNSGYIHSENVNEMHNYGSAELNKSGYYAYYMYKQKKSADELENTGFSKSGCECLYNIDNISDGVNIIACGANAISKRIFGAERIERQDSPKDIKTYSQKIEQILLGKRQFFN
jgi:coproporphyrinogen dehydrogenase HemZ